MRKIVLFVIVFFTTTIYANSSVFVDDYTDTLHSEEQQKSIVEMVNLKALQNSFFVNKNGNSNNILNILFKHNNTYRIRTRYAMTTLIVLDNDTIAFYVLGDEVGFDVDHLGMNKYDLSNMLLIKPMQIGIDTSLTIIGESGNIYSFYLFSTDYTNIKHPNLVVYVSEENKEIKKLKIRNLEKEAFEKARKEREKQKEEEKKRKEDKEFYLTIGKGINTLKIDKREIQRVFEQRGEESLLADDIFRDNKFTYFKYDANDAKRKFPVVYRVVEGYDNPVNSRIVGDYIIAETVAEKFTLRLGDDYACVRELK